MLFLQPWLFLDRDGQHHVPATLPPWITRYPMYRRLVGPQCRYGRVPKISLPQGFDPWTIHPVDNRHLGPSGEMAWKRTRQNRDKCGLKQQSRTLLLLKIVTSRAIQGHRVLSTAGKKTQPPYLTHVNTTCKYWRDILNRLVACFLEYFVMTIECLNASHRPTWESLSK